MAEVPVHITDKQLACLLSIPATTKDYSLWSKCAELRLVT
jgi:hypothetical protein